MGAEEAERSGLVARVVAVDELLDEALKVAATIASDQDFHIRFLNCLNMRMKCL